MSTFDPETFLSTELSLVQVTSLIKADLVSLAKNLKIPFEAKAKKSVIRKLVVTELVSQNILDETDEESVVKIDANDHEVQMMKLKLQQMELEYKYQAIRDEREFHLRELEIEHNTSAITQHEFDVSKYVKLVPHFNEKDVENYFLHFEKIAINLKWPKSMWCMLLQSHLVGKSQEIYSSLTVEQCSDYDFVKPEVLKAYELVPEAYRQRFRKSIKHTHQTHVEFAHYKEVLFDRWCTSLKVDNSYNVLREQMLLEEFKNSLSAELKTHLNERNISTLSEAAITADEYVLAHKTVFQKAVFNGHRNKKNHNNLNSGSDFGNRVTDGRPTSQPRTLSNEGSRLDKPPTNVVKSDGASSKRYTGPTCYYCGRKGHVMSKCFDLKRDKAGDSKTNPVSFVNVSSPSGDVVVESQQSDSLFKGFLSKGSVSSVNCDDVKPVNILRDTGAAQSLMLDSVLPMLNSNSSDEQVVISGIGGGYTSVPLCQVKLDCNLVSGSVPVGVVSKLPVKGIDLSLGNDLAGNNVVITPHVVADPVDNDPVLDKLEDEFPGIFPACAVTRAKSIKCLMMIRSQWFCVIHS